MSDLPEIAVLLARDHPARSLERRARQGELTRVGRGSYAAEPPGTEVERRVALARARIAVTAARLDDGVIFSHASAALLWDLPTLVVPDRTHVIQRYRPGGRNDPHVFRHVMRIDRAEWTTLLGRRVTTLERTVVDCACSMSSAGALVIADAALRAGADPEVIVALVRSRRGARGVAGARLVCARADAGAESPGETLTRLRLLDAGLPVPTTQIAVATHAGRFRIDLGWPEHRVGIEFDGRVKYSGLFGRAPVDALIQEKRREDALREAGWTLLRVTWQDLQGGQPLAARARRLLRRAEFGTSARSSAARVPTSGRMYRTGRPDGGGAPGGGGTRAGGVGGGT